MTRYKAIFWVAFTSFAVLIALGFWQYENIINIAESREYLTEIKKRADNNDPLAMHSLGYVYYNGIKGIKKDPQKAFEYYKKAADLGLAKSQGQIGVFYEEGLVVEKDLDEAIRWYKKSSAQGNAISQLNLGRIDYRAKRYEQAFEWFQKSAKNGQPKAQGLLADMYADGEGVPINEEEAFKWYLRAAENGNVFSQHNLALLYSKQGKYENALKWLKKSSNGGISASYHSLGHMLETGKGTDKNFLQAGQMYRKAKEGGYKKTRKYLEDLDKHCVSMNNPEKRIIEGCLTAAAAGMPKSQKKLASLYHIGKGVPKDSVEAFAWSIVYTLSFSPDEIKTPEKKKELLAPAFFMLGMNDEQTEMAKKKAKEYMAKYSSKEIPGSKEYLKELEN